jgi:LSM domain
MSTQTIHLSRQAILHSHLSFEGQYLINMNDPATTQEPSDDLTAGPFSVLYKAVKGNLQVLVNVRNNHKLLGRVKAYDRHMNL